LPTGVVSVDLHWDAPDEAGVVADILAKVELADIVDVGGAIGKSGLDEEATDTRMKDLGRISCRSGGNHHHWLMGCAWITTKPVENSWSAIGNAANPLESVLKIKKAPISQTI